MQKQAHIVDDTQVRSFVRQIGQTRYRLVYSMFTQIGDESIVMEFESKLIPLDVKIEDAHEFWADAKERAIEHAQASRKRQLMRYGFILDAEPEYTIQSFMKDGMLDLKYKQGTVWLTIPTRNGPRYYSYRLNHATIDEAEHYFMIFIRDLCGIRHDSITDTVVRHAIRTQLTARVFKK